MKNLTEVIIKHSMERILFIFTFFIFLCVPFSFAEEAVELPAAVSDKGVALKESPFVKIKKLKNENAKLISIKRQLEDADEAKTTLEEVIRQEKIKILEEKIRENTKRLERIRNAYLKHSRIIDLQRDVSRIQSTIPKRK